MEIDPRLHFITAALYFVLGWRVFVAQRAGTGSAWSSWNTMRVLTLAGLAVHGIMLHFALFPDNRLDLSLGQSLSLIAWVTVAMYWVASFRFPLGVLEPLILFGASGLVLMPLVLPSDKPVPYSGLWTFKVHLVVSLMAYGLFAIAALHAILMGILEKRLHNHDRLPRMGSMPSLVAMDALLFQMIMVGFLLLTATLISGVFFSEALFGKPLAFNHKVVFSFISWLIYGGLLAARQLWGVRGRRAARWTLAGFVMLLTGYVGSKFVLEILLHRG